MSQPALLCSHHRSCALSHHFPFRWGSDNRGSALGWSWVTVASDRPVQGREARRGRTSKIMAPEQCPGHRVVGIARVVLRMLDKCGLCLDFLKNKNNWTAQQWARMSQQIVSSWLYGRERCGLLERRSWRTSIVLVSVLILWLLKELIDRHGLIFFLIYL